MSKHTKGKLALNIWGGPDSCCRLQGTKQVHVVKKCRCQLGRNHDKAVWDSPLWLFMQMWKNKHCGTTYLKCMRQVCVNKPFSFPRLVFLSAAPPLVTLLFTISLLWHFLSAVFSAVSLFIWWIWYKKLNRGLVSLSFVTYHPFDKTCVRSPYSSGPRQVSPISKVKPLLASRRAAVVLTRLSLYATLPACLRGWHLKGTDRGSVTLFPSPTALPECYHQMFWAAATSATWKHTRSLRDWGGGGGTERGRADFYFFGGAFF